MNFETVKQYIKVGTQDHMEEANPECGHWVKAEDFEYLLKEYKKIRTDLAKANESLSDYSWKYSEDSRNYIDDSYGWK